MATPRTLESTFAWLLVTASAVAIGGCESNTAGSASAASGTASAASSAPSGSSAGATGSAASSVAPPTSAAASSSGHVNLPGRSPLPTVEEWSSAREVTVRGSSALKCETKLIREWFLVTCREHDGYQPGHISLVSDRVPGMMMFPSERGISLVMPYVEGSAHRAVFNWNKPGTEGKRHTFVAEWPRGAPKPPIIARFEGADSPLPPPPLKPGSGKYDRFVCDCYKTGFDGQVPPIDKNQCETFLKQWPVHEDCAFSYHSDCRSYYSCSTGGYYHRPKCSTGFILDKLNYCRKKCTTDKDCGEGEACLLAKGDTFPLCKPKSK